MSPALRSACRSHASPPRRLRWRCRTARSRLTSKTEARGKVKTEGKGERVRGKGTGFPFSLTLSPCPGNDERHARGGDCRVSRAAGGGRRSDGGVVRAPEACDE